MSADIEREPTAARAATTVTGIVARLHFAWDGQPDGVVLRHGELILVDLQGLAARAIVVGARVRATGVLRVTLLHACMLDAQRIALIDPSSAPSSSPTASAPPPNSRNST